MRQILLSTCLLLGIGLFGQGDLRKFPVEPAEFIKEMEKFMKLVRREECDQAFEAFNEVYKSGALTDVKYASFREICDMMLEDKHRQFPQFSKLLNSATALLSDPKLASEHFGIWVEQTKQVLSKSKQGQTTSYEKLQDFFYNLFKHKSFFFSTSHSWGPSNLNYKLISEGESLVFEFPSCDIIGNRTGDSVLIKATSGKYNVYEGIWYGESAYINWPHKELENVRCNFEGYKIDVKQTNYTSSNATLYHPTLFDKPIKGKLIDKIVVSGSHDRASFPRFESNELGISIKDIGEGVEFHGGFKLQGQSILGFGTKESPAMVHIKNTQGKKIITLRSETFSLLKGNRVVSNSCESLVYFEKDSIYHPNVEARYIIPKRTIRLSLDGQDKSNTPFFDSYHQMELYAQVIEWNIDEKNLEIGKGEAGTVSKKEVQLESFNLFDLRRHIKYHNVSNNNPLTLIAIFWREVEMLQKARNSSEPNAAKVMAKIEKKFASYVKDIDSLKSELDKLLPGERKIGALVLAKMLDYKFDVSIINRLLHDLSQDGFIYYNPESQIVTINDKIFHYNDASVKKVDYDIIKIKSAYTSNKGQYVEEGLTEKFIPKSNEKDSLGNNPIDTLSTSGSATDYYAIDTTKSGDKANAIFDMSTNNITMNWVRKVVLSDSQKVSFDPIDYKVKIYKNRDMSFSGRLFAGRADMRVKNMYFNYERFEMYSDSINDILLNIPKRIIDPNTKLRTPYPQIDEDGFISREKEPLSSLIEGAKGLILIDAPNNKSSKDNIPIMPSIETKGNSYVFYDFTRKGAYKREKFYFELKPFTIDSLDSFDPAKLKFKGKLVSSGIFPDIEETAKVMWHDLSLGFEKMSPTEGYPIYGGKGRFTNRLSLSNYGLVGNGYVDYIGSRLKSDDIIFLPESMSASSDGFKVEEKRGNPEFPNIDGDSVKLVWIPYKDSMYISSVEGKPFKFFKGNDYFLDGKVILTPGGVYGSGQFDWEDATINSPKIQFKANSLFADTSTVKIKSLNSDAVAFDTKNVKSDVDFDEMSGRFISNTDDLNASMPYSQMSTNFDDFTWNMREQTIKMANMDRSDGLFFGTSKQKDSLAFYGRDATYDLNTNALKVDGVNVINVADASVYPIDKVVQINSEGEIGEFTNAKIIADTTNKYHVINRATVKIENKNEYKASGFYEYNVEDKKQEVEFSNVTVNKVGKNYITNAQGQISEESNFYIDRKVIFTGDVKLTASSKNLQFNGFAKLKTNKIPESNWFNIHSPIDRKNVEVKYGLMVNPEREKLYVGIYMNRDSPHVYTNIIQPKVGRMDRTIFQVEGVMKYIGASDEFVFKDSTRIKTNNYHGNHLTVSDQNGKFKAEGAFLFGAGLSHMQLHTAGEINSNILNGEYSFQLMAGLKMPIPEQLANIIHNELATSNVESIIDFDYGKVPQAFIKKALGEFIQNPTKVDKIVDKLVENDKFELPVELGYTFFFPRFDLTWSNIHSTFFTKGKLGISSINGKSINQDVEGVAELRMGGGRGDEFSFYFVTPSEEQYFFNYKQGLLTMVSSNEVFNTTFNNMKKKDKEIKMPDGEILLLELGPPGMLSSFKARCRER